MSLPRLVLRLALREMRGGFTGLWSVLACLGLGVAAMAMVGGLSEGFTAAIAAQASVLMGGDLEVSRSHVPIEPERRAFLESLGRVSACLDMRGMASAGDGPGPARRTLVSLKAVDRAYPLTGALLLDPPLPVGQALAQGADGLYGAVLHPDLLARLGVTVGDTIGVGDARFRIRAAIVLEPDRAFRILALGPRLIVSLAGLEASGLIQPGSMIRHGYRVKLPDSSGAAEAVAAVKRAFPDGGWRVAAAGDTSLSMREGFRRLGGLLTLVGLAALVLGGLGVREAVTAHLEAKTRSIAVFRALGASRRLVFWIYLPQIAILALAGVALGLAAGTLAAWLAAPLLGRVLPIEPLAGLRLSALAPAGAFGLLTALAFALPPLSARAGTPPLSLFRGYAAPERLRPGVVAGTVAAALGLGMAWLVLAVFGDTRLSLGFLGSLAACAVVFALAGRLLGSLARALPRPRSPRLALALAALGRPGGPAAPVVTCLGLGLTTLCAVALSDANFQRAMRADLPEKAPAFFFLDIQATQLEDFLRTVRAVPGVTRVETSPSLRGRIVRLKGVPVDQVRVAENVAWAVRGDRSFTWAGPLPGDTRLTDGAWWPADYAGPPLASLDEEVARGLGLAVGDRVTVTILGREIELTVASLRRVNWLSLGLNHVFVLSPGVIGDLPLTSLATAYTDQADAESAQALYRAVTERFGNVSVQRVDEALADVGLVARQVAAAIRVCASTTLAAGLLVLSGSLRAALARRMYELAILKVCGATRADILAIVLGEWGLAGLAAGLAALALGSGLSWFFVSRYLDISWSFFAAPALGVLAGGTAATIALALAGLWRALSGKTWPILRNE